MLKINPFTNAPKYFVFLRELQLTATGLLLEGGGGCGRCRRQTQHRDQRSENEVYHRTED
jgi:hypothetical protein